MKSDLSDIYNQFQVEDDSDYEFVKIVDHPELVTDECPSASLAENST
jgi:hypothetical protein